MSARIALLVLLCLVARATALPFDTVIPGGRSAAMGGMQGLSALGPDAVLGNPAGLVGLAYPGLMVMARDWYSTGVRSYSALWARPLGRGGAGLAWHRFGEDEIWTEDLLAAGGAWPFAIPSLRADLDLGITLKLLQIAAPAYTGSDYAGDYRGVAVDFGIRVTHASGMRFAWVGENLLREQTSLIDGGETWHAAQGKQRLGFGYLWHEDLEFGLEYLWRQDREGKLLFGAELGFYDAFLLRGGAGLGYAAAGFGLRSDRWQLDTAFESRKSLGTSLILSLNYVLGEAGATQ